MKDFMRVIEEAIGQMCDSSTLLECIAEVCEREEIDYKEMSIWIKEHKSLLSTLEKEMKNKKLLKNNLFEFLQESIEDFF